jgi:hypothetical protein
MSLAFSVPLRFGIPTILIGIGIGGVVTHSPLPPPYLRVRIRRFSSVELDDIEQPGKAERVEGSNGKS